MGFRPASYLPTDEFMHCIRTVVVEVEYTLSSSLALTNILCLLTASPGVTGTYVRAYVRYLFNSYANQPSLSFSLFLIKKRARAV